MKKFAFVLSLFLYSIVILGQEWKILNSGTTQTLNCVYFTSETVGYVAGAGSTNPTLLKTIDGGSTWNPLSVNSVNQINSISFGSKDVGYVITENNEFFKTINAGSNWIKQKKFINYQAKIYFINSDTGFVASSGKIYRTKNGGVDWDSISVSGFSNIGSIHFPSRNVGYIVSFGGKVAKTTDMGDTWNIVAQPTSKYLWDVYFTSEIVGYAVGGDGLSSLILKTIDGGYNWVVQETTPVTSSSHQAVFFTNQTTGYLGNSTIYQTTDEGSLWQPMNTPKQIKDIFFPSSTVGYAVGYNGAILKLSSCDGVFSFKSQPSNFSATKGGNANFIVETSNNSANYQWQSDLGLGFQDLKNINKYSGTNTTTLNINSVDLKNHSQSFRVVATVGGCIATSDVAFLTIADTCVYIDTVYTSVTDTLKINIVSSGINTVNNANTLKIYPNPAKTHIYIDNGSFLQMNNYKVRIDNNLGQSVYYQKINQQQFYIDLSGLAGKGLYLIHIIDNSENVVSTRKLILE